MQQNKNLTHLPTTMQPAASTSVAETLKVAIDIDLAGGTTDLAVVHIVVNRIMTPENWRTLIGDNNQSRTFNQAVSRYVCDICHLKCSPTKTVYTNKQFQGADLCVDCVCAALAFGAKPMPGWHPGPVYSLKALNDANFVSDSESDE